MNDEIERFQEVREYLMSLIDPMIDVYLSKLWDPLCSIHLIKEIYKILNRQLLAEFPDFPPEYLPQCRIKIYEEDNMDIFIQNYFNEDSSLVFLGCVEYGIILHDLYYYKPSFDFMYDFKVIERHGHSSDATSEGSKTAAADYYLGKMHPLSVAYQMSVEDGLIKSSF